MTQQPDDLVEQKPAWWMPRYIKTQAATITALRQRVAELEGAWAAFIPLLRMITIRQVMDAGNDAIDACGLDPWCINEGRASGDEPAISDWRLRKLQNTIRNRSNDHAD